MRVIIDFTLPCLNTKKLLYEAFSGHNGAASSRVICLTKQGDGSCPNPLGNRPQLYR